MAARIPSGGEARVEGGVSEGMLDVVAGDMPAVHSRRERFSPSATIVPGAIQACVAMVAVTRSGSATSLAPLEHDEEVPPSMGEDGASIALSAHASQAVRGEGRTMLAPEL
jgi:hypothetical protein